MKNRVLAKIAGEEYTIVAEENEGYIRNTAEIVDKKISEIVSGNQISTLNAAVLAALNLADDYLKAVKAADNMRSQMKSYLEDASRLRSEINEMRREITRLKTQKQ